MKEGKTPSILLIHFPVFSYAAFVFVPWSQLRLLRLICHKLFSLRWLCVSRDETTAGLDFIVEKI